MHGREPSSDTAGPGGSTSGTGPRKFMSWSPDPPPPSPSERDSMVLPGDSGAEVTADGLTAVRVVSSQEETGTPTRAAGDRRIPAPARPADSLRRGWPWPPRSSAPAGESRPLHQAPPLAPTPPPRRPRPHAGPRPSCGRRRIRTQGPAGPGHLCTPRGHVGRRPVAPGGSAERGGRRGLVCPCAGPGSPAAPASSNDGPGTPKPWLGTTVPGRGGGLLAEGQEGQARAAMGDVRRVVCGNPAGPLGRRARPERAPWAGRAGTRRLASGQVRVGTLSGGTSGVRGVTAVAPATWARASAAASAGPRGSQERGSAHLSGRPSS